MKNRIIASIVGAAAIVAFASAIPKEASAVTAVMTPPIITCDNATVALGETLHCIVTNTAGLTPSVKITYTNPQTHSTINVWNGQGQTFDVHYTPQLGEVGRAETLLATVYVPTYPGSRLAKPYTGYTYFSVVAAPVAEPATTFLKRGALSSNCTAYPLNNVNGLPQAGESWCYPGTVYNTQKVVVYCWNQPGIPHYGPIRYNGYETSKYTCTDAQGWAHARGVVRN